MRGVMEKFEGGELLKMENLVGFSPLSEQLPGGAFDFPVEDSKSPSLGFLELLGLQDFSPSMFELPLPPPPPFMPSASSFKRESSDTTNFPATPNSSSISSSSTEAATYQPKPEAAAEEGEDKNLSKGKKKGQKRQREPRYAFMTKSEMDHLEDGYRWRKYGQKGVKNSPFPRSYYRCTSKSCGVKKMVERSSEDPTVVVTTYVGQHTHLINPVVPRGSHPGTESPSSLASMLPLCR